VNTIEKMVPHDISRGVVAAFSGGADSLALLITLLKFVDNKNIVALYVNHRLRPEEELKAEEALPSKLSPSKRGQLRGVP